MKSQAAELARGTGTSWPWIRGGAASAAPTVVYICLLWVKAARELARWIAFRSILTKLVSTWTETPVHVTFITGIPKLLKCWNESVRLQTVLLVRAVGRLGREEKYVNSGTGKGENMHADFTGMSPS